MVGSSCAVSALFPPAPAMRAPGATRAPGRWWTWTRSAFPTSNPARKCASGSTSLDAAAPVDFTSCAMRGRGGIGRRWRLKIFCHWRAGSSPAVRTIACLGASASLALLAGCDRRADVGPVVASVIGAPPELSDASRGDWPESDRALADSVAQGLVRFDATGQIEPGVAERWNVADEGMTYIFRLREAVWSDGRPVTAQEVVAILKHQIAAASRNPLKPFLTSIESIVEMTPQVIQ